MAILAILPIIQGYRILFLVPFPAPSHWLWLKHFSEELIKRGHEVNKCAYYIIDVQLNDFFVNFRSQQSQIIRQPYQILITPKS